MLRYPKRFLILFPALAAALAAGTLTAQPVSTPHVEAELVGATGSIVAGRPFHVALRLTMEEGWHTYWRNPGDAGMPTSIEWKLPEGFTAGAIAWPAPELLGKAPEVSYGYSGQILLPVEITPPATLPSGTNLTLKATASWLVCKEVCIPGEADLSLDLPIGSTPASSSAGWSDRIAEALAAVPGPLQGWSASARRTAEGFILRLVPSDPGLHLPSSATFFAGEEGTIDHSAPQEVEAIDGGLTITLPRSPYASEPAERLRGVILAPTGWNREGNLRAMELDLPVESGSGGL